MIFSTNLSERFFVIRKIERDIFKNVYWIAYRSTGYSCQIFMKLEFYVQISEKYSGINFMKLCPLGAELHADGQTDMTKLIVTFRNFANAPEKYFDDY
jgi:hypothetical protein